jgi:hypothetical protein
MTYVARTRSRFLALAAFALAAPAAGACSSAPAICNCPAGLYGMATVPATASNAIGTVSTDAPCSASIFDSDQVIVTRNSSGTCQVRVQLANGDTYALSFQFQSVNPNGCCANITRPIDASVPQLVDAGAGGAP